MISFVIHDSKLNIVWICIIIQTFKDVTIDLGIITDILNIFSHFIIRKFNLLQKYSVYSFVMTYVYSCGKLSNCGVPAYVKLCCLI